MPPRKKQTDKRKGLTTPAAIPPKKKKSAKSEPDSDASTSKPDDGGNVKKMRFSRGIPVDEHCKQCQSGYHVYGEFDDFFNTMLNLTNIGANNNKYYLLQLLKNDKKEEYVTWFRWGRVGKIAGTSFKSYGPDIEAAKLAFEKKFKNKTGQPCPFYAPDIKQGKYAVVGMDYGNDEEGPAPRKIDKGNKQKQAASKLDKRVGDLVELIFDVKEFEEAVREMEYDVKKAPLGKLTAMQIRTGYESLKEVETCLQKKKSTYQKRKLEKACSEFYTRIPHDFGMKRPPLISTTEELKAKLQLLEALGEIQIVYDIIKAEKTGGENLKDVRYRSLGCKLEPLDSTDADFKMVKDYAARSQKSDDNYYKLKVDEVFKVERDQDEKRFKKNIGNRMLLWHGSGLTNWCGILKEGLRIAPPEAPVSGYMFGKGVYFADMACESANYCCTTKRQPKGFLMLCEVALGKTSNKTDEDYNASKLPPGHHSTKGMGEEWPDPKGNKQLGCGTIVPLGKPKKEPGHNYCLPHNEYVVYDVAQIRPRYLMKAHITSVWD